MRPNAQGSKSQDVISVLKLLSEQYPDARTELTYGDSFQLLVAVILSAQCTDVRVNLTTPALFAAYPSAQKLGQAKLSYVEKLIHSCGFYRQKAKSIVETAKDLVDKFQGEVPRTMDELTTLRGVGRKTASVVLSQAFDLPAIAVDTHVKRVSGRLGWAQHLHPEKIEKELCGLIPKKNWSQINGLLILHGRRTCKARKPLCESCVVNRFCAFYRSQNLKS